MEITSAANYLATKEFKRPKTILNLLVQQGFQNRRKFYFKKLTVSVKVNL